MEPWKVSVCGRLLFSGDLGRGGFFFFFSSSFGIRENRQLFVFLNLEGEREKRVVSLFVSRLCPPPPQGPLREMMFGGARTVLEVGL